MLAHVDPLKELAKWLAGAQNGSVDLDEVKAIHDRLEKRRREEAWALRAIASKMGAIATGGMTTVDPDLTAIESIAEGVSQLEARFGSVVAQDLFDDVIESLPDGLLVVASDGRIARANFAAHALAQCSRGELIGVSMANLIAEWARVRKEVQYGQRADVEATLRAGQETVTVALSGSALQSRTRTDRRLVFLVKDISARKVMEKDLATARDEALASTRMKSVFLANVSHEIRTPLNGVLGMLGLLLDRELGDVEREYAQTARRSATTLLDIVNDILDFSKMEAGKLVFEEVVFGVRSTVDDVLELLALEAERKKLALTALIPRNVPVEVRGDPGRLRQVLTNLLSNAIKFTHKGSVVVRVDLVADQESRCQLRFEVEDSGIGIDDDVLERIFEPFVQADGSTTRRFGGTGLGLAISRQLVERMGGELSVESRVGVGSVFRFDAHFGRVHAETEHRRMRAEIRGMQVVIGDESDDRRHALAERLEQWRAIPASFNNSAALLTYLRRRVSEGNPAEAVLVDIDFGGKPSGGLEVSRRIHADETTGQPPTVVFIPVGREMSAAQLDEAGAAVALSRPIRDTQLFDCLMALSSMKVRAVRPRRQTTTTAPLVRRRKDVRLLVVEDNAINLKLAIALVERMGFSVDGVMNGEEALDAMARTHYDLIFMDCQMPVMDGYEATRAIRERLGDEGPIVVAMTAHAASEVREKCEEAGMNDYIGKPVDESDLRQALDEWLGEGKPRAINSRPPSIMPRARTIDPKRLEDLRSFAIETGKPELIGELFDGFLAQAKSQLRTLHEAIESSDHERISFVAHALKGGAANLGIERLASMLARIEHGTEKLEQSELLRRWNDMEIELGRVRVELKRMRPA